MTKVGDTTLTPRRQELEQNLEQDQLTPLYHAVLLDDDEHTYDYVVEMLQKLFLRTRDEALRHAIEVDSTGRTIVLTSELPLAEFARDQIHAFGADWRIERCRGSMSAVVEPAGLVPK